MKFLYKFFFLLFIVASCSQENTFEEYDEPYVSIKSITKSLDGCDIVLSVNKGINTDIKDLRLIFNDKTIGGSPTIITVPIPEKRVGMRNVSVKLGTQNHTFDVKAELETSKKVFSSNTQSISFEQVDAYLSIDPYYLFNTTDIINNKEIHACFIKTDSFFLTVNYKGFEFQEENIQVLLNGSIPVKTALNRLYPYQNYATMIVYLPENLNAGDYNIHFKSNKFELISDFKIRILEGKINIFDQTYQDKRFSNLFCFTLNDNTYFVGGESKFHSFNNWALNMNTKKWSKKNDFIIDRYDEITYSNLQSKDNAYLLTFSYNEKSIKIYRYNILQDKWELLTTYPGTGQYYLANFIVNGKLYVGGGGYYSEYISFIPANDLWAYDLETNTWEKKKNVPFDSSGKLRACNSEQNAYILNNRILWEYNSHNDSWIEKVRFTSTNDEYYRNTLMTYLNEKIYFVTLLSHKDVIVYDVRNNNSKVHSILPFSLYEQVPFFAYQNKLYIGYVEDIYTHQANIYEITP